MNISDKDLKMLWGRSAGRCSKPSCGRDCVPFLDPTVPTVVGEMAHVIAQSPCGPRGVAGGGTDTYDNLVLLCPTHHTEVDKAPSGTFPPKMLLKWKQQHEALVNDVLKAAKYTTIQQMCGVIKRMLIQNKTVWMQFGPESIEAQANPASTLHVLWELRKLDRIVPNNSQITKILEINQGLFSHQEYAICSQFIVHAQAFESNCYRRTEGVPRFPDQFEALVDSYVTDQ
jgi:hypothetical protein